MASATAPRDIEDRPPARMQRFAPQVADRHRAGVLLFLIAAGLSFVLSVSLWFLGSRDEGMFVGLWVPSILAAGAFWILARSSR